MARTSLNDTNLDFQISRSVQYLDGPKLDRTNLNNVNLDGKNLNQTNLDPILAHENILALKCKLNAVYHLIPGLYCSNSYGLVLDRPGI